MSSQNLLYDAELVLEDGAAAKTATGVGQDSAAAAVLDLGGGGEESVGPKLPANAAVEVDVTAIDTADGNETYEVQAQVSADSAFTAPVEVCARVVAATGKYIMPVTNEVNGTRYRYLRVRHVIAGTTPSVTYTATLSAI